jgi:hypothetical protein
MHKDARGLPLTLSNDAALEPYERALRALRTYRGDPTAPIEEALALAPDFAAAHATKALILLSCFERRFANDALAALDQGAAAFAKATQREKFLAAAARKLAVGDWHGGVAALDRILVEHPARHPRDPARAPRGLHSR